MAHRNLWLIDMGDGTWAVCCLACRRALYRGPKPSPTGCSPAIAANQSSLSADPVGGAGRPSPWPPHAPRGGRS
jgi:hypothetical protein